ncbi:MAG: efflux RND transporter periplasmic adaptor subunit [Chloroflexi bacterium]|nr:efflux RND transporter periplasmic adaptor subunit [Chloroflexota bacterium]
MMAAFAQMLGTLKLGQIMILLVVLVGTAGGSYAVYAQMMGAGGTGLAANETPVAVVLGDLVNQVSTNGSITFPNTESLSFITQGTVAEIYVEEGDFIETGQPVASLDSVTNASLNKAVAQAGVNLQKAEETLDADRTPSLLVLAQAESALADARIALRSAEKSRDTLLAGPDDAAISKAQSQVDATIGALSGATQDRALVQRDQARKVTDAVASVAVARESYRSVPGRWLGINLTDSETTEAPSVLVARWGIDLDALFSRDSRANDIAKGLFSDGPPADDPTTPWSEAVVYAWLNFYPGSIQGTCGTAVAPVQGDCIDKEWDIAWTAYQVAVDGLSAAELQAARAIASAEDSAVRAESNLVAAQDALAAMTADVDPLDKDSSEKRVAVAMAKLHDAQAVLAGFSGGGDALRVALLESEVASASAALGEAKRRLTASTLTATISGVVAAVNVIVGQSVTPNVVIATITDPTVVEVAGVVDEIDILFVRVGARAVVTMDALRGQALSGTVSAISSASQSSQGVVSYSIRIQVEVPAGIALIAGLSANASILVRQDNNVLLVPSQAIYGTFVRPYVRVLVGASVVNQPVVLGNSDDFWVIVSEGLGIGDRVVMEVTSATTSTTQLVGAGQAIRGLTGGGFGGQGGFGSGAGGQGGGAGLRAP